MIETNEEIDGLGVRVIGLNYEDPVTLPVLARLFVSFATIDLAGEFLDPLVGWKLKAMSPLLPLFL
jgi:hypothetical protein